MSGVGESPATSVETPISRCERSGAPDFVVVGDRGHPPSVAFFILTNLGCGSGVGTDKLGAGEGFSVSEEFQRMQTERSL